MKTSSLSSRVIFMFLSAILISSCSKDNNPLEPKTGVLTSDVKQQLEAAADKAFMNYSTPGMIALISVEGEEDYILKRGVSNIVTGEPMSESNYFRIASNTKTFTGTAVLLLVDEGKINLDLSIAHYLPEYNIPNGDKITVRMLGNMTSGLYNYTESAELWDSLASGNFLTTFTPKDLLSFAFKRAVNFEPGSSMEYSNTNTVLLGLLIEKVTGKPARQVIAEKVLQPLNMTNTYWPNTIFLQSPYLHGYTLEAGNLLDATNWNPSWGYTAGALISNMHDMKIWAKALSEGTLLSENMRAERFRWINDFYGFCIMKAGNWVGHSGSISGYNSHVLYNSERKITLIVLTNMDTDSPVEYFSYFFREILDK